MDLKKQAAEHAVGFIESGMVVGLGGGSAVAFMADLIRNRVNDGLQVQLVSSSFTTKRLLEQNGLPLRDIASASKLDLYFDGCDQFDKNLNALKSGGGIHTHEKILAVAADEFILVGDQSKYVQQLDNKFPLVIEVISQALSLAPVKISQIYPGARTELRISNKKDGPVCTENGNYLFDLWFNEWPPLSTLNPALLGIPGVLETSLFYQLASRAVIGGDEGLKVLSRTG